MTSMQPATGRPDTQEGLLEPIVGLDLKTKDETGQFSGRKAAKSLRIFREKDEKRHSVSEPNDKTISSAIYFPHSHTGSEGENLELEELKEETESGDVDTAKPVFIAEIQTSQGATKTLEASTSIAASQDESTTPNDDDTFSEDEEYPLAVELQPFKNKVGGHTAIFKFSHRAVCKALVNRENRWYENMEQSHPELLQFIPKYIGVLNVRYTTFTEDGEPGELDLTSEKLDTPSTVPEVVLEDNRHIVPDSLWSQFSAASSPISEPTDSLGSTTVNRKLQEQVLTEVFLKRDRKGRRSTRASESPQVPPRRHRYSTSNISSGQSTPRMASSVHSVDTGFRRGSIDVASFRNSPQALLDETIEDAEGDVEDDVDKVEVDVQDDVDRDAADGDAITTPKQTDDDEMFVMDDSEQALTIDTSPKIHKETTFERFLMLEDLTSGMEHPCVLDLKMGTRQYGIEAIQTKRESQRRKCRQTTSLQLGVRTCGMQVWDLVKNSFVNRDKYFGRRVTAGEQFVRSLSRFLYDGLHCYSIVKQLPTLIENIGELRETFATLNDYRLYGSSILLMYDSSADTVSLKSNLILRMIDFAQCVIGTEPLPSTTTYPPSHLGMPDFGFLRGLHSLDFYFRLMFHEYTGLEYDDAKDSIPELRTKLDHNIEWLDRFDEDIPCPYNFSSVPNNLDDYDEVSE